MVTTEVKTIHLQEMKNAKFIEFVEEVNNLIIAKPPITTALKPVIDEFSELVEKAKKSLVATRGNSKTELMNLADEERDKVHRGLVHVLHAYRCCNDPVKETAAENLFFAVKQYGLSSLREADNDSETSLLDALVESVTSDKYANDVAALPEVNNFMIALGAAIDKFKQVKSERVTEQAEKIDYTTREVRTDIVPVYRTIVGAVEAMTKVGVEPAYAEFIAELNAVIEVS